MELEPNAIIIVCCRSLYRIEGILRDYDGDVIEAQISSNTSKGGDEDDIDFLNDELMETDEQQTSYSKPSQLHSFNTMLTRIRTTSCNDN